MLHARRHTTGVGVLTVMACLLAPMLAAGCGGDVVGAADEVGSRTLGGSVPGGRVSGRTVSYVDVSTRSGDSGYAPRPGVLVTLGEPDGDAQRATTGSDGWFDFSDTEAGVSTLTFDQNADGNRISLEVAEEGESDIEVLAGLVPDVWNSGAGSRIGIWASGNHVRTGESIWLSTTWGSRVGSEIVWILETDTDAHLEPTYWGTAPRLRAGAETGKVLVRAKTVNATSNTIVIWIVR